MMLEQQHSSDSTINMSADAAKDHGGLHSSTSSTAGTISMPPELFEKVSIHYAYPERATTIAFSYHRRKTNRGIISTALSFTENTPSRRQCEALFQPHSHGLCGICYLFDDLFDAAHGLGRCTRSVCSIVSDYSCQMCTTEYCGRSLIVVQWHVPVHWPCASNPCDYLRMDHGQLLLDDGLWSILCLLAVVWATTITNA
jgi:hypothetical protein